MNASGRYVSNKPGTYLFYLEKNMRVGIWKIVVNKNPLACQCYTLNKVL